MKTGTERMREKAALLLLFVYVKLATIDIRFLISHGNKFQLNFCLGLSLMSVEKEEEHLRCYDFQPSFSYFSYLF